MILALLGASTVAWAARAEVAYDSPAWAGLVYWGRTANNTLIQVLQTDYGGLTGETLYSVEGSYRLSPDNALSHLVSYLLKAHAIELNVNLTYRDDITGPIDEFNPYFSVRWANFPWDRFLRNTFAIGEGISYDSHISNVERDNTRVGKVRRFLNFLMFEVTFALPSYPNVELVFRVHHRSGMFGVYGARNTGASAIGLGVRYRF